MRLPELKETCKAIRAKHNEIKAISNGDRSYYGDSDIPSIYRVRQTMGSWIYYCGGKIPEDIRWSSIPLVQQATDNFLASLKVKFTPRE